MESIRKFATFVLPWMDRFASMGAKADTFLFILSASRRQKALRAWARLKPVSRGRREGGLGRGRGRGRRRKRHRASGERREARGSEGRAVMARAGEASKDAVEL
eukprot:scaffold20574_cov34-Tisochrysis_lutea.AAC.6